MDFDGRTVKDGVRRCFADAQHQVLQEVELMRLALAGLQAENTTLKVRLQELVDDGSVAICGGDKEESPQYRLASPSEFVPDASSVSSNSCEEVKGIDSSDTSSDQVQRLHHSSPTAVALNRQAAPTRVFSESSTDVRLLIKSRRDRAARISHLYHHAGFAQRVARSPIFQGFTLVIVVLNAIWIAIDLDFNGRALLDSPLPYQLVEHALVVFFLSETVIRFAAFQTKVSIFHDVWFLFDAVLVALMVGETWVLTLIIASTKTNLGGLGSFSVLRLFRLLRIARMAQICRFIPELQTLINSTLAGIRSVFMTVVCLLIITYTFAIILRQLGQETSWGAEYFSTVPGALHSLLVLSVLPEYFPLGQKIGRETWYCGVLYAIFLTLTVVMMLNMLVAILCDVIFRASSEEADRRNLALMSEKLRSILRLVDLDANDIVSRAEFDTLLRNEDAVTTLVDVGVDVVALADDGDVIFGKSGREAIPFDEFKEEVLMFRTSNHATVGSIMAARRFLRTNLELISNRLYSLEQLLIKAPRQQVFAEDCMVRSLTQESSSSLQNGNTKLAL